MCFQCTLYHSKSEMPRDINHLQVNWVLIMTPSIHEASPRTWSKRWSVTRESDGQSLRSLSFKQLCSWSASSLSNSVPAHNAARQSMATAVSPSSSCSFPPRRRAGSSPAAHQHTDHFYVASISHYQLSQLHQLLQTS